MLSLKKGLWDNDRQHNIYLSCMPCVFFKQFSKGWSYGDQMCEISKSHPLLKPYKGLSEKVFWPWPQPQPHSNTHPNPDPNPNPTEACLREYSE